MIPIYLDRLIAPEAAEKLRTAGLDKVASAMLRKEGHAVGDSITLHDAIAVIGMRLREKNAGYTRIVEGINSLKQVL